MAESLEHRLLIENVPNSVVSPCLNDSVLKNSDYIYGYPEYTGTDVLVKSVVFKVPAALAYDVARSSVGCQFRCRPRHLTAVPNYELILDVLKLLTQAINRQLEKNFGIIL